MRKQFCGFFFSAVWWAEIVEKTSSRPNHLWFRLTLTVKLDHHQWTHKKVPEKKWGEEKSLDFDEMRELWNRKKSERYKIFIEFCSRFYWLFILVRSGELLRKRGRVIVICTLCPLRIEQFIDFNKWNGNVKRIWALSCGFRMEFIRLPFLQREGFVNYVNYKVADLNWLDERLATVWRGWQRFGGTWERDRFECEEILTRSWRC
jgi:hypothetical protein